jgi:glycerophosphoryl diester phosphodiesterase
MATMKLQLRSIAMMVFVSATNPLLQATAATSCPPSPFRSARTLIIAHASGEWFGPPNSIEMMLRAKAVGADQLDLDVRVTKDGELVAAHDDIIGKSKVSIGSTTLADLKKIDLRETWSNRGKQKIASPVRIPTVAEALAAFPKDRFGLEFKTTGGEQAMCTLLRTTKRTSTVYISSAGDAPIDAFKPLCPEVVTTVTDAMVPLMQSARKSGTPYCSPVPIGQPPLEQGDFKLTKDGVGWEHQHGLAVYTWTADSKELLQYVATLGVDAVYTARPDLARKILRK